MKRCEWLYWFQSDFPEFPLIEEPLPRFREERRGGRELCSLIIDIYLLELLRLKTGRRFWWKRWKGLISPSAGASRCSSCVHLPLSPVLDPKMWIAGKLGPCNLLNFLFPMIRSFWQMEMKCFRLGMSLRRCWSVWYCLIIIINDLSHFVKLS